MQSSRFTAHRLLHCFMYVQKWKGLAEVEHESEYGVFICTIMTYIEK